MGLRIWLWLGAALDLVLLAAALYMAISAVDVVSRSDRSPPAIGIAVMFLAFPVLCIAALFLAWRAYGRGRSVKRMASILATPWIYFVFLAVFLGVV
jgi:hypothetical protein